MLSLAQLKPGEKAVIDKIRQTETDGGYLMEMGMTEGTKVRLVKFAPLGDPLEISVRGYHLSLRRSDANSIIVKMQENDGNI